MTRRVTQAMPQSTICVPNPLSAVLEISIDHLVVAIWPLWTILWGTVKDRCYANIRPALVRYEWDLFEPYVFFKISHLYHQSEILFLLNSLACSINININPVILQINSSKCFLFIILFYFLGKKIKTHVPFTIPWRN